jgi:arsenate reductase
MLRAPDNKGGLLRLMGRVLVLCTGNSCRSIMAEALINSLGRDRHECVSAGSLPTGSVHPRAMATLQRHGITAAEPRSKSWHEFAGQDFDLIITVCDQAAGESCPAFAGAPRRLHWSIPDPAAAAGPDDEVDAAFDNALGMLRTRIEQELL